MTSLYQSITSELYKKDLERLNKATQPRRLTGVKASACLQDELNLLEEYAFQGMLNGIINFTPHHHNMIESFLLGSRGQELDSFILERLSFLRTSDTEQHYSQKNYHFLHLTFQEFFAARHFVKNWRHDRDIACLSLDSSINENMDPISPTRFLQTRKYDPQLNIFWRFVTGLVQILEGDRDHRRIDELQRKRKNIVTFFDQLNDTPVDLLEAAHRRLLMYCLSEVLPSNNEEVKKLRSREESFLKQWTVREFKLTDKLRLGREAEIPETVLCALLSDQNGPSRKDILSLLEARPSISTQTLDFISEYMSDQFPLEIRLIAMNLAFKNSRIDTQKIVVRATQTFSILSKSGSLDVRSSAMDSLMGVYPLPVEVVAILIIALGAVEWNVRLSATRLMVARSSLPAEAVAALIIVLKGDKGGIVQRGGAKEPERQSLPTEVTAWVTALKDNYDYLAVRKGNMQRSSMRIGAIKVLAMQSPLPIEAITALITIFEDEENDREVRESVAEALGECSLPVEAIDALITALQNEDEDIVVRQSAAHALGGQNIPAEDALIGALKDHSTRVRRSATKALSKEFLSAEAIAALITTLEDEDEDHDVRESAAEALGRQTLSAEAIAAFIIALKDHSKEVRESAAEALGMHSLSAEDITALIMAFADENYSVRRSVAQALARQCLSAAAIAALIAVLEDGELGYSGANDALIAQSSLSTEAIAVLIAALEDTNSSVQYNIGETLSKQSSLPAEAIAALIRLFQEGKEFARIYAAQALTRSSLPAEAIAALVAALEDEDSDIRGYATGALAEQLSLPAEAIAALIAILKEGKGYSERSHAAQALTRPSLPAEAIAALVAALEDEDSDVREYAARALAKQLSVPEEAITALIAALGDEEESVREQAAEALTKYCSLPPEAVDTLITMLEQHRDNVINILCSNGLLHSAISKLGDQAWKEIWLPWVEKSLSEDIYCYEFEGVLYVWLNGVLHKIPTNASERQALIEIVRQTNASLPSDATTQSSPPVVQGFGHSHARAAERSVRLKRQKALLERAKTILTENAGRRTYHVIKRSP